jgi:UDP:flavonoid glycosyltransferase YjiC (YdhE family)
MASGRPWVRIVSCNPAEVRDPIIAPFTSGYPAADPSRWAIFRAEYNRVHADAWYDFDTFCRERGAPGLANTPLGTEFMHESPFLNLYAYPAEADYRRANPLGPTWHRLDSTIRATDGDWTLPENLAGRPGSLIYLSLGSLGSADVELLQRLIDILGRTEHRIIVSKGPLADQIHLHDNMAGAAILPQPAVLGQVDLVITHGGNNTVVESFHNGKPMVVLPLFWDQVDNAQRLQETGFGRRLPAYAFRDEELSGAIDGLLSDAALRERMAGIAARMQADRGTERAADLIERVATTHAPVLREP